MQIPLFCLPQLFPPWSLESKEQLEEWAHEISVIPGQPDNW